MKPACEVTHPQILAGICPWCEQPVGDRSIVPDAVRVWNIPAMSAALDDADDRVRQMTVSNLMHDGPSPEEAVPLLFKALNDACERTRSTAGHALSHLGRKLSAADIGRLESQMANSPHELAIRIAALGYYFLGDRESEAARQARHQHIFWVIQNAPEHEVAGTPDAYLLARSEPEAYLKGRELWLAQVESHPRDTWILGNAASFFTLNDDVKSEELLEQARSLEPDNPEWPERLGRLYSSRSHRGSSDQRTHAAKAFRELKASERLQRQTRPESQSGVNFGEASEDAVGNLLLWIHKLPELAKAAFDAGELERAKNYASELLEKSASPQLPEFFRENNGNAVHYANLILGRIAFQGGDVEQAKRHLLASAESSGSPNLNSFGPNMSLAQDLLEHGEREIVLVYFERCARFWESGADQLEHWKADIERGAIPDFGANLVY
jgi:tetratricopeptide (TPR) repeat protein